MYAVVPLATIKKPDYQAFGALYKAKNCNKKCLYVDLTINEFTPDIP